jgi:cysteine-rich repeat protein
MLENPTPDPGDQFGAAVAAVGDDIAVGAPLDDGAMIDTGTVYLFDAATGVLLETLPNPAQARFDHFGASLAAGVPGLLIGAPGPSRIYVFAPAAGAIVRSGRVRAAVSTPGPRCGNGIVEEGEACDDGNAVDTDDCRNDCSGSYCCAFDPLAGSRCDDGDPCTNDVLDSTVGCRHIDNGTCCPEQPACAGDQTCSLCAGCFLYPWDCCARQQRCLPLSPECTGATCFPAASCECAGGLTCTDGEVPSRILRHFTRACDQIRLQATFSPQSVPSPRRDLLLTRSSVRKARRAIGQAVRITRKLAGHGRMTRSCRAALLQKIATVKRAIPQGKRLRRCVAERRVG